MRRLDVLWGGAFVVLLLLGSGAIPTPGVPTPDDSFSEESAGKRGFYLVTEQLLTEVSRSTSSLIPQDEYADTLVMLGPARYPDRAQWQTLHDWVSGGRALVFAARAEDPAVELEPFGIEVVPYGTRLSELAPGDEEPGDEEPAAAEMNAPSGTGLVVTELVEGSVEWRSQGEVRTAETDASVELSLDGAAQVVWRPVGDGAIVVVASDSVFTNRSLTDTQRGLLAFRILETAAPAGPVYFDEFMNAAGAPRVVGILLEDPFRQITLQLSVVVFLFAWMVSRRFGPVHSAEPSPRRSLVEHAEALGNLHFKTASGARLVSSYLEFFRRELGLRHSSANGKLERDPTARVDRSDPGVLDGALRAATSPNLSRERVGEVVRSLARLRDASQ